MGVFHTGLNMWVKGQPHDKLQHCNTKVKLPFPPLSVHRLVDEQQQRPDGSFHCGGISSLQILTESVPHPHTHVHTHLKQNKTVDSSYIQPCSFSY